jgi:hypothetical protein
VEGIRFALMNISRRFSRKPQLETAARHLIDSREELERQVREFMPEVIAFSRRGYRWRMKSLQETYAPNEARAAASDAVLRQSLR